MPKQPWEQWEYQYVISRLPQAVATEEDERPLTLEEFAEENERAERDEEVEEASEWQVWLSPGERLQAIAMGYRCRKVGKAKRQRPMPEFHKKTRREFKCSFCWRDFVAKPESERRCYHCGKIGGW